MTNETCYKDSHKSLQHKATVGDWIALLKNVQSSGPLFQPLPYYFGGFFIFFGVIFLSVYDFC